MQKELPAERSECIDYVGAYEQAMRNVVAGCGSREAANRLVSELHRHYEKTAAELQLAGGNEPRRLAAIQMAKKDASRIIEKYAPHTGSQFHELVLSYSFAAIAFTLPLIAAASLATVITGIAAAGSSVFIGTRIIGNWKAFAGRHMMSELSHKVSPRHIKALPRIIGLTRKK